MSELIRVRSTLCGRLESYLLRCKTSHTAAFPVARAPAASRRARPSARHARNSEPIRICATPCGRLESYLLRCKTSHTAASQLHGCAPPLAARPYVRATCVESRGDSDL